MNNLEVWNGTPPSYWDELVCRLNGTVFHSSLWAEYQGNIQNACPIFLLKKDGNGNEEAGAVALFRKSQIPAVAVFVRELVLLSHPFVDPKNTRAGEQFIGQCEELGRQWGCSRISIESFYSGYSPFLPQDHGYKEVRRVEFSLDLQRASDILWQGIKKDQRERIRRLERVGVVVSEGTGLEDLRVLKLVREATQGKRTLRGQHYTLSTDEKFYRQLDQYLLRPGIGRIFLAKLEDEILASIFYATFNGKSYSVFSGSTDRGYKLSAQSGLFWGAVKQFQSEGFRELNRGGVPESASIQGDPLHGIYSFKQRLGTTPLTCRSGIKILSSVKERVSKVCEWARSFA